MQYPEKQAHKDETCNAGLQLGVAASGALVGAPPTNGGAPQTVSAVPAPCLNRSSAASGCFNTRVNQQHLPAGALGFAPACSGPPLLRVRSFRGLGCWQMRFKCGWTASDTFPVRWADVAGAVARRRCRRGADFTHCSRQYTHRITTCTAEAGVIVSVSSQRKAQEPNRRRMDGMQPLPGSPLLGASCGAAASPVPSCCRCCLRRCRRWPALMAAR